MDINGYRIDGDSVGLRYLIDNSAAIAQLIDRVRVQGSASFMYQQKHYVVLPTSSGAYTVNEGHNRTGPGATGALRRL